MKFLYTLVSFVFITALFSNCGGSKILQEQAPAQFQQAYVVSGDNSLNLHIPVAVIQPERVDLRSVYFRGMKADLEQDPERPGIYVAKFNTGRGDMVMHKDPKEEYGNRAPQRVEKAPVEIDDNEAVLVYSEKGDIKFYKISNIEERSRQ